MAISLTFQSLIGPLNFGRFELALRTFLVQLIYQRTALKQSKLDVVIPDDANKLIWTRTETSYAIYAGRIVRVPWRTEIQWLDVLAKSNPKFGRRTVSEPVPNTSEMIHYLNKSKFASDWRAFCPPKSVHSKFSARKHHQNHFRAAV